jgi:hypothetical protein
MIREGVVSFAIVKEYRPNRLTVSGFGDGHKNSNFKCIGHLSYASGVFKLCIEICCMITVKGRLRTHLAARFCPAVPI